MRGKLATEIRAARSGNRFNEARALCAGNCPLYLQTHPAEPRFNEARALCAGNCPEAYNNLSLLWSFNEARALCAGNFGAYLFVLLQVLPLQ